MSIKILNAIKIGLGSLQTRFTLRHQLSHTEHVTTLDGRSVRKPVLSNEERLLSYAHYHEMIMERPAKEYIDAIERGPIASDTALPFENINELMNPGYLPSEIGWCFLSDGTGYVSSIVQMPEVTGAMIDWWFAWHPLVPLRYKIWNPKVHYDISVSDTDRLRLQDRSVPLNERVWGVTQIPVEDIGLGPMEIGIHFKSPQEMGFDMTRFSESVEAMVGTNEGGKMVHIARKSEKGHGIELRTRFWFPQGMPEKMLQRMNYHALEEYTHLAKILPSLYRDHGPEVSDSEVF